MTRSAIIRPRRAAAAAIAAVCLFLPVPGQAAGTPAIVSPPGNTFTDYHPAVIERGDELTYVHLDPTGGHDVTATCEYLRGPNDPPGGPFTKPGPGCGVVVGADNADHCFRREMPFPALGEAWDPSQAAFYYVHKDAYAHPNYTGPYNPPPPGVTLNPALAAVDPDTGELIRARAFAVGRCPIFYTRLLYAGEIYPIEGLQNVVPGQRYDYRCMIHNSMDGLIVVLPARP